MHSHDSIHAPPSLVVVEVEVVELLQAGPGQGQRATQLVAAQVKDSQDLRGGGATGQCMLAKVRSHYIICVLPASPSQSTWQCPSPLPRPPTPLTLWPSHPSPLQTPSLSPPPAPISP